MRPGVRHVRRGQAPRRAGGGTRNVVYTTGMLGPPPRSERSSRERPFVTKLTADPALRARPPLGGSATARSSSFQVTPGAKDAAAPAHPRRSTVRRCRARRDGPPSTSARLAIGWGVPRPNRVTLLPNPTPPVSGLPPHEELRKQFGLTGPTLVFAGPPHGPRRSLDLRDPGGSAGRAVDLVIAGDGPGPGRRWRRLGYGPVPGGALPSARRCSSSFRRRRRVAALVVLGRTSRTTVVEALAVGTPVDPRPRTGGRRRGCSKTGSTACLRRNRANVRGAPPAAIDRFFFLDPAARRES